MHSGRAGRGHVCGHELCPYCGFGAACVCVFGVLLGRLLRGLGVVDNMFCASTLLHKGSNMRLLRAEVHKIVDSDLKFCYDEPTGADKAHNAQLVQLLEWADQAMYQECPSAN
jgi:hypothetical protein